MMKEKSEGHSSIFVFVFHLGYLYHIGRRFFLVFFGTFGEGMKDWGVFMEKSKKLFICVYAWVEH
jgi:hypothetical protein